MADTKLRAILDAENQMTGPLSAAQGSLSKLGGAVRGVALGGLAAGATVAIGAVAGLGAVLASSVKEAMAAEEVSAALDAVLRSTGGAAGVTRDMAMGLADSLSQVTRFEDDVILAGENVMLTFTGIGKQVFPDAMTAALNLSTAMGTDLQGSVVQIGKALNDPIQGLTALSRVGVSFTDQQKAQIQALQESGDVMGAQKIILAELNKEFGGAAVAAGQTFAGQLDILRNNLGNVKESIGTALLPALTSLASTLGPVLITAAQGFATWATTTLVPLLQQLFTWLATNIPIAIQTLSTFWTTILQPAVAAVWSFLQINVLPILQQLGQWLATNIPIAIQALATFWTGTLQPAMAIVWSFIQDNVIPLLRVLADVWLKAVKTEAGLLAQFWTNVLQPALAVVWSFIQNNVIPILAVLLTWLTDNIPPAIQGLADFWTNVLQPALAAVWAFIQDSVVPILATLLTWLADNIPPAIQGLADFWTNVLQPALAAVWAFIQDNIIPLFEALANVAIALLKKELEILAGIWQNVVKPALEAVWAFIQNNVMPILEALAGVVRDVVGPAFEWFKGVIDPVAGAIDAIGGVISGVIDWLHRLADTLNNIRLPAWLTPGSPTPFEWGLRGINDALRAAASDGVPAFELSLSNLGEVIQQIVGIFNVLAGYFADPTHGVVGAKAVTDALAPIFDNLTAIMDGLNALLATGDLSGIRAKIDQIESVLRNDLPLLVAAFVDTAPLFKTDLLAAAVAFSETASKLVAPITGMVQAFEAIVAWAPARIEPILGGFMLQLRKLARAWIEAAKPFNDDMLAGALWFAEVAAKLVAPITGMVQAFEALAGWSMGRIVPVLGLFMLQLRKLARAWIEAAKPFNDDMLAGALWFAEVAAKLVAPITGMVQAFEALAGYVAAENLQATIAAFVADVLVVAVGLKDGLGSLTEPLAAAYDGAIAFGERIGRIVGVIQPGVSGIQALAGYVAAENLPATLAAFVADVLVVAVGLKDGLGSLTKPLAAAYDGAIAFGERIGRIVGVIQPGVSGIQALAGYVAATDIGAAVRRFAVDLLLVTEGLKEALRNAPPSLLATYDAAIAFAERIGKIVGVIQPGISAIQGLATYTTAQHLEQSLGAFTTDILRVADYLKTSLADPDDALLAAYDGAAAFGERITRLIGFVQPGLDALRALSSYGSREATALHAGMERFVRNVASLINYLASHLDVLGPGAITAAGGFASQIATLVTDIRRGLSEMSALEALQGAYDAAFATAQNWMSGIIDGITSRLGALEDLMEYLRGLFPSSPAEHGPWQTLPDGKGLTAGWMADLTSGLGQTRGLESALGDVHDLMSLGSGLRPSSSATTDAGQMAGSVTLNLSLQGPFYIREEADIAKLAEKVGDYVAAKASKTRRMGQQRTSVGLA